MEIYIRRFYFFIQDGTSPLIPIDSGDEVRDYPFVKNNWVLSAII